MEENPTLYRYTNCLKITLVTNKVEIAHETENERFCAVHWFDFIRDLSMLRIWYTAKGKIGQKFQGCLCPSCARRAFFLHKSTYFHDIPTECQRKGILIYFLLYSFFQSLPDHLRPNLLAR